MKNVVIVGAYDLGSVLGDVIHNKGWRVLFYVDSFVKHPVYKTIKPDEVRNYLDSEGIRVEDVFFLFTFPLSGRRKIVIEKLQEQFDSRISWWDYRKTFTVFNEVFNDIKEWWWIGAYDKTKAHAVVNFFDEEKSNQLVNNWLKFRESYDMNYVPDPDENQYAPEDLPIFLSLPEQSNILDIGASFGYALDIFLNNLKILDKKIAIYIGLEPFEAYFINLVEKINIIRKDNSDTIFIPLRCACGQEFKIDKIFYNGSIASMCFKTEREEGQLILVLPPDDVFFNLHFHLIKMDIEGYEINCLRGLQRIIKEYKPILMVPLYHKPEDIYEIPFFVKSLNPDYKLYVRVHGTFFMETVLYAIP